MADRYWDKFGFQLLQQNLAFMRCPADVKGVFLDLRILAGNCEAADGSIPLGSSKRAKLEELLDYFTDYGDAKNKNIFRKRMERLRKVGMITVTVTGTVKITGYEEEQDLGRTRDTNRKREKSLEKFQENVNAAGTYLKKVFEQSGARALPYDMLHSSLRHRSGCIKKTADALLVAMIDAGVLLCVSDDGCYTLASLGNPLGFGSGSAGDGSNISVPEISAELDTESEPEIEGTTVPSTDPTGSVGARGRSSSTSQPTCAPESGGVAERSEGRDCGSGEGIPCSPEDAWSVRDPLRAVEAFLITKPGWSDKQLGDKPASKYALRGRWRDLRKAIGPKAADKIWRQSVFDILSDHCDRQSWNSWSAGFLSKLKIGQSAYESLQSVED